MKTASNILSIGIIIIAIASMACDPRDPQDESVEAQSFALEEEEEEEQNPWQTHQYLSVVANKTANHPSQINLTVEDWGPSSNSKKSSYFRATVRRNVNGKNKTLYACSVSDPKAALVSRLPDGGSFIGPNKALVYTIEAPGCRKYPAATFTVTCSADSSCHTKSGGLTKGTLSDGTHTFVSYDREELNGLGCTSRVTKCTVTFDNRPDGGSTWIKKVNGMVAAYQERQRGE